MYTILKLIAVVFKLFKSYYGTFQCFQLKAPIESQYVRQMTGELPWCHRVWRRGGT